jgi:hypothetical protein
MTLGRKDAGKTAGEPRVVEEFSAQFDDVRFPLADEEYDTLIRMEMRPGTEVRDYLTNTRFRVGKDDPFEDHRELFPRRP